MTVTTCSRLSSRWTFLGMFGAVLMCRMTSAASMERRMRSRTDSRQARGSPSRSSWRGGEGEMTRYDEEDEIGRREGWWGGIGNGLGIYMGERWEPHTSERQWE